MRNGQKTVVLVGLMGSGKSRIGIELSRLLKLPFSDSDREIEQAAGLSISDIFSKFGEEAFRQGEKKVMLRLLAGDRMVLASGGGAFVQDDIRAYIKEHAVSVWLKSDIDTLLERTSRGTHRPLLQGGDRREALTLLMEQRYPFYEQADIAVSTDHLPPATVARHIRDALMAEGYYS